MTTEYALRLRKIYGVALSVIIVITGICLIAACICIYAGGGDEPYSRQSVADAFSGIAFPVYLCLGMIVVGFVLDFLLPAPQAKTTSRKKTAAHEAKPLPKKVLVIQWSILCVAVAALIYGFVAGGTADVLTKAVNICTECVGLG